MIKAVIIELDGKQHKVPWGKAKRFAEQVRALEGKEPEKPRMSKEESDQHKDTCSTLWELSPKSSRTRTSKKQVWDVWLKTQDRPSKSEVVTSYKKWLASEKWTKDDGAYVEGLHRWIRNRQWENDPAPAKTGYDYAGELKQ